MFKSTFQHLFDRFRRLDDRSLEILMFKPPSHHLSDKFRRVANQTSIRQKSFILFQISNYRKQLFECSESTYRNDPSPSPRTIGKWHSDSSTFRFDAPRTLKSRPRNTHRMATWVWILLVYTKQSDLCSLNQHNIHLQKCIF
jgi:hypothetical protein